MSKRKQMSVSFASKAAPKTIGTTMSGHVVDRNQERFAKQRKKWGFDERELYSLDHTIAEFVLPRLKVFASTIDGHPSRTTYREWKKALALMIFAFEMVAQDKVMLSSKKDFAKFEKGMRAFADNFTALWN